jgi:hypothetical protein
MNEPSKSEKSDSRLTTLVQAALEGATQGLLAKVLERVPDWRLVESPSGFRAMELEIAQLARSSADQVTEILLRAKLEHGDFQRRCSVAARAGAEATLRSGGARGITVTLLGGAEVRLKVGYLRPDLRKKPGRKRASRGKGGAGFFPSLDALGIWSKVTPALAGEVARQVTDSDSIRTGLAALDRRGIGLEYKTALSLVNGFGKRAVEQRAEWLSDALTRDLRAGGPLAGMRVVIGIDGGRLRERVALRGRRSAKTGHHRFEAPWREPKLFTIYLIDEEGAVQDTFRPIYDGTMADCDDLFAMLGGYLRGLGAHEAKELAVVGDGAKWIWDRVDKLADTVGISRKKVRQIVDWFHAVEVLEEVADARAQWPEGERTRWLKRAKDKLHAGQIDGLLTLFDELALGRRAKQVNKHRDYFDGNAARMNYQAFLAKKLPNGSGAIESVIRRVVNMRMKGNGTFWRIENAEAMLLLRSYLKAGRFDDLVEWSITAAAPWWISASSHGPVLEAP